ncbi:MAG TPA: SDR family oxidoreductase [Capillimicrobium sp.]|nr:SDR family oxidoreductase [Capillimicrobium sp.]
MALDLDGAVAVVTGGGSGIGAAAADFLERGGARVHRLDLKGAIEVDVTSRPDLEAFASTLDELHVLVNAAGILTDNAPAEDAPIEDFQRALEVNVVGTVNACQIFGGLLRRSGRGAIVNVASQAASVALPSQSAYTTSKGAVVAFTRALAVDWARQGVRVNAVAPGFTVTPLTAAFFADEAKLEGTKRRIPLGRVIEAEEVAAAIGFLASPLASAITGAILAVDGGWTAGEASLPW